MAFLFSPGLLLGWAREKTGGIWVPIWMHALNNTLAAFDMLRF